MMNLNDEHTQIGALKISFNPNRDNGTGHQIITTESCIYVDIWFDQLPDWRS